MEQQFSTRHVALLTRASVRQIDHWSRTGLVTPSGREAKGKGTRRRYTFLDVVAIKTIGQLRERNCPLQSIRKAVHYLKAHYPGGNDSQTLARMTLLTDGRKVYVLTDERRVMEVVTGQSVWSIPLGLIIAEVQQEIKKLPAEWIETVKVAGKTYHLDIVGDSETNTYTVQCKELPGAIEQGDTAEQAVANGKEAIRSVLTFLARRKVHGGIRKHVRAG